MHSRADRLAVLRSDLRHATAQWDDSWQFWPVALGKCLLYPRIRAVAVFRLSAVLWQRRALRPAALWLQARTLRSCGAELHPATDIGPGLLLVHSAGIVIHPRTVIGRDVALYQGVSMGEREGRAGLPCLGDRVRVGAGAILLGGVTIGDDAHIGAGALVLDDVPAWHVAIGSPARSHPRETT